MQKKLRRRLLQELVLCRDDITPRKKRILNFTRKLQDNYRQRNKRVKSTRAAILAYGDARNRLRKLKSRRWTRQEKLFALALYRSPKAYNFLNELIALPCRSTLTVLLSSVPFDVCINHLRQEVQKMDNRDKYCALYFSKMSLRSGVYYNEPVDLVDGFEDFGTLERHIDKRIMRLFSWSVVSTLNGNSLWLTICASPQRQPIKAQSQSTKTQDLGVSGKKKYTKGTNSKDNDAAKKVYGLEMEKEVALRVSHSSLMSSDRMKPSWGGGEGTPLLPDDSVGRTHPRGAVGSLLLAKTLSVQGVGIGHPQVEEMDHGAVAGSKNPGKSVGEVAVGLREKGHPRNHAEVQ
uniref:Transposable element P transposase-like RNase H domain-containing protein n=1 Tax=Timema poppense TaxID=170557 RepID=A0A7R9DEJ5_TIMPO|nr:unnamed protein product [Timema poppensis]